MEYDPIPDDEYANKTHKFLHEQFGAVVTSNKGILFTVILWGGVGFMIYYFGLAEIKLDFKTSYFINDDAYINDYLLR
jgi:hypothetical protein